MTDFTKIPCISKKYGGKLNLGKVKHKNFFEHDFSYKLKKQICVMKVFSPTYDKILSSEKV